MSKSSSPLSHPRPLPDRKKNVEKTLIRSPATALLLVLTPRLDGFVRPPFGPPRWQRPTERMDGADLRPPTNTSEVGVRGRSESPKRRDPKGPVDRAALGIPTPRKEKEGAVSRSGLVGRHEIRKKE